MKKKFLLFLLIILFVLIIGLMVYVMRCQDKEDEIKTEAACQRIEYFTKNYFRLLEDVRTEEKDGKIAISVSFIPEIASYPIKEEIYQNVAYHALQITEFFPEVSRFDYSVLWNDNTKQEVLSLTIDENAIEELSDTYYNEIINQNGGFKTSFKNVFSSVLETEESRSWRDTINTDSNVP